MTPAPDGLPPLREVIRRLELSARKSLSQNYILDLNLTGRIARATGDLCGATVVEIGPGPGGLTRALLAAGAARVIAIERDERFIPALEEIAVHWPGRLKIVMGDAMDIDAARLADGTARVIANLPYAIATPLIIGWLKVEPWPPWWEHLALMVQREVADRIVAAPGSKAYGRLAVASQWRSAARVAFHVPARAFTPPPKVDSAVVVIAPKPDDGVCRFEDIERLTTAAFGQRRKMLRSSLKSVFADVEAVLARHGLPSTARAEELTVAQMKTLATVLRAEKR
jgi:16S rRNA (adenine1518-N6/adenine1519-N6)-dimethyltransferase